MFHLRLTGNFEIGIINEEASIAAVGGLIRPRPEKVHQDATAEVIGQAGRRASGVPSWAVGIGVQLSVRGDDVGGVAPSGETDSTKGRHGVERRFIVPQGRGLRVI